MAAATSSGSRKARWYCYKCYREMDEEDGHNKPAAFSRGFQMETMAIMWELKTELAAIKEELNELRNYYLAQKNGGVALTN